MNNENDEMDLLQQELSNILKQLQNEMDGTTELEIEEIHGVNLKELEKAFSEKEPKLDLRFVKCHADAVSPSYNYPTDSGFDLHSTESVGLPPLSRMLVGTGLKFNIKDGYEIQIRPKSGLALKQGLTVLNTPGTVDAGYDGEIKVIIFNTTNKPITINKGMKVGQAVLCPVVCGKYVEIEMVQNIEKRERGINGFGSTGIF
jgi:dUTP pyrophosphatase